MRDGKTIVIMDKPIYLRQAILHQSKIVMCKFHYDYMKPKYGEKCWLCYMDTDSLVYDIKTDNFYEDTIRDIKARFDICGYSRSCPLPMGQNKKVIGLMKDELGSKSSVGAGARRTRESRSAW